MVHDKAYSKLIFSVIFYLATFCFAISSYFKHTIGLLWGSYFLFFIFFLYFSFKFRLYKNPLPKKLYLFLLVFLLNLFWFVIISPYKLASLDAFLLDYFFNIVLFFLFFFFAFFSEEFNSLHLKFWHIFGIITFLSIVYAVLFFIFNQNNPGVQFSYLWSDQSLLRFVIRLSPPLVLVFYIFLGFFFENKSKIRYIYLSFSLIIFIYLIFIGRRMAFVGIFIAFILFFLMNPKTLLKRSSILISLVGLIIIIILLFTSLGRKVLYEGRDNFVSLFTHKIEEWPKSGSLGLRFYAWHIYLKKSLEEPFSGTGLDIRVVKRVLPNTVEKVIIGPPHNAYISLILQAGWQTCLMFLIFSLWTLKKGYDLLKLENNNRKIFSLNACLFLFLITFLFMALFAEFARNTMFATFWIAAGLIWGYSLRIQKNSISG